ncbi:MAG: TetR family transcriptional regulator [Richelia sp.]|nr:TetR family transcriptional regulator [Richelia sp.]CDN14543.1 HTH-type transcriptional regulator pksA [Richelia intracellularis]
MTQQKRRLEVSEAAWWVIVREGLDRTSIRASAQEMGCTTGVVTHYFRNKQELILFALNQVTEKLKVFMGKAMESSHGAEAFIAMLSPFLPLDTERQDILRVWVAFLGYAVGRENMMTEHQNSAAQLRAMLVKELERLQVAKILRQDINPEIEANALLALLNGVSMHWLIQADRLTSNQQQLVIRRYVNELLVENPVSS